MAGKINNKFLINSPAGSGKTTEIKKMINRILTEDEDSNILCITYTNRAADELLEGIESDNVQIQTIHSFMNSFMKIYFSHDEIKELFFEIYGDEIKTKIENKNNKSSWERSNERFKEEYGKINYNTVINNIDQIKYNELDFNTLYYGGLSHDDLLSFSKHIIDRFDVIEERITKKFKYIFIDEYQDTSADVLKFFYEAVENTETKLYLLGDRMQQIYKNYNGTFEEEFKTFDTSIQMDINYRSSKKIVNVLNNIYNDSEYKQEPYKENMKLKGDITPQVLICNDVKKMIDEKTKTYPGAIKLFAKNRRRFEAINASNLYTFVSRMNKYGFGRKYSAVDILTDFSSENPDILFRILFCLERMYIQYQEKIYGKIIQKFKYNSIFNEKIFNISNHSEKEILSNKFSSIFSFFDKAEKKSIQELLEYLEDNNILKNKIIESILDNEDYEEVIQVKIIEFKNLTKYLRDEILVSTQHGVKGEGHDIVFFICQDAPRIKIKMYDFFRIWSEISINFTDFQDFYYLYLRHINDLQDNIGMRIYKLKKNNFEKFETMIINRITKIYREFKDNVYFKKIYLDLYEKFIKKSNVTNFKKLKASKAYMILNAYKIFYVGCSRAKIQLIVFVDESKVSGYKEELIEKLNKTGFEIEEC